MSRCGLGDDFVNVNGEISKVIDFAGGKYANKQAQEYLKKEYRIFELLACETKVNYSPWLFRLRCHSGSSAASQDSLCCCVVVRLFMFYKRSFDLET